MTISRRHLIQTSGAAALLASIGRQAWAQAIESTKVIAGFAPGGTADIVSRRVADKLHPGYAKSAVVENKTGAGGQIAVQFVKTAAPDGATVLLTPMSMLGIYPHTYKKLPYDPVADLTPVSAAAVFDYGFAVGPMVPASVKTVPEFLAWCKANPSLANFGSPAAGSSPHFIGALLGRAGNVDLRHVAFRGTQPAVLDMVGGQIAAVSGPTGEFTQQVAAGKCRLLSTSGPKRSKFTPNTPTLREQGFKDMAFTEWFGFFLPAKAPQDVVQRLNAAIRTALASQDVIDGLAMSFLEVMPTSPAQLAAMLKADTELWGPLVKAVGFTPEG
ncbi:Bug family tripartite tricarboxylate transporter substrate binding protein [Polaromonas jejuensis]|uniref:Bug family tripartite tricarboxylate transporter substrate binding protein n=1 Tax=Polaromonas jejuensis TaxID=457502 RepID=A0ABW0Q665_9BURK|nr:Bug family tripartite tricarboxylate transporter substrate binding protein [Polaromonas jejuensis]